MRKRLAASIGCMAMMLSIGQSAGIAIGDAQANLALEPMIDAAWMGERAMHDIEVQLSFGSRALGTAGHERTVRYIRGELARAQVKAVVLQRWMLPGKGGTERRLTNIIGRIDPDKPRRIVLATHYDSIIRAYRDAKRPDATMPGANNSASGVALLLETARALESLIDANVGIDLVFLDGEEGAQSLGEGDASWAPLGSPYFVAQMGDLYPSRKPEKVLVFDMVCFKKLELHPELSSLWSASREVWDLWRLGKEVAPSVFSWKPLRYSIGDDQSAFQSADIPSVLVIGYKYDPWYNTVDDTIDKCSSSSLEAVGRTVVRYVFTQK